MAFTYSKPANLAGQQNGKLTVPMVAWHGLQAHPLAQRSLLAMEAHAKKDNLQLSATGIYRSYTAQVTLFNQRYVDHYVKGQTEATATRHWNGKGYYKKLGVAAAATPGTSNHGWGLAVDFAGILPGKPLQNVLVDPDGTGPTPKYFDWLCLAAPVMDGLGQKVVVREKLGIGSIFQQILFLLPLELTKATPL